MFQRLTVLIAFLLFTGVTLAAPKIEVVGGNVHDWGSVKLSDGPLNAKIKITNTGDENLIIQNVKPSCGCTTAPLDKDVLAPGDTSTLDLTMKISKGGKTMKNVRISSNDPDTPQFNLRIQADVVEFLSFSPSKILRFKDLEVGKESTAQVSIVNKDKKPISISKVDTKPNNMILTFKDSNGKKNAEKVVIKPGEKIDVIATVTPQKDGYFRANIDLTSDHPDYSKLSINGYGQVKSSPIFNNK
jgi:hypothetical protein